MSDEILGFIGLGNMGQPMARNIQEKGHAMIVHDIAGTAERTPRGAEAVGAASAHDTATGRRARARRRQQAETGLGSSSSEEQVPEELEEADVRRRVQAGMRPDVRLLDDRALLAPKAEYCALLERCWSAEPGDRPTMMEVVNELQRMFPNVSMT